MKRYAFRIEWGQEPVLAIGLGLPLAVYATVVCKSFETAARWASEQTTVGDVSVKDRPMVRIECTSEVAAVIP